MISERATKNRGYLLWIQHEFDIKKIRKNKTLEKINKYVAFQAHTNKKHLENRKKQ